MDELHLIVVFLMYHVQSMVYVIMLFSLLVLHEHLYLIMHEYVEVVRLGDVMDNLDEPIQLLQLVLLQTHHVQ